MRILTGKKRNMTTEEFKAAQAAMSDQELITKVKDLISNLAKTGGRCHKMTVPPEVTDTDMLLSELVNRFEELAKSGQKSDHIAGVGKMVGAIEQLKWIALNDQIPEIGIEYLGYNPEWINEDYNPKGVRIWFRDDLGWYSAKYNNTHDCWDTTE